MLREAYHVDEWRTLQFAPLWVFGAVAGADGKVDEKELEALLKEISQWPLFKEPLVQETLLTLSQDFMNLMAHYKADSRNVLTGLKDVADLLDRKATQEQAKNFKGAMLLIGRNTAQASGGGFLGTGDKISSEEKGALAMVILTLRAT
jgi:hypothetical protein